MDEPTTLVDGPRASEQYAAALAAFVAGMSGELGQGGVCPFVSVCSYSLFVHVFA